MQEGTKVGVTQLLQGQAVAGRQYQGGDKSYKVASHISCRLAAAVHITTYRGVRN